MREDRARARPGVDKLRAERSKTGGSPSRGVARQLEAVGPVRLAYKPLKSANIPTHVVQEEA